MVFTDKDDTPKLEAYTTNLEYLSDELKYLDAMIRLQIVTLQERNEKRYLENFRGLVLSDEEINGLVKDTTSLSDETIKGHDDLGGKKFEILIEELNHLKSQIEKRRVAALKQGTYLSLPYLSQIFHLTLFEERCLMICLAPELDRKYEKIYAYLQNDVTCKKPSIELLLNLLCNTIQEKINARLVFDNQSPMLKYRFLHITGSLPDNPTPLLSRSLKLDDRIVGFLLGFGHIDSRLESVAHLTYTQAELNQAIVNKEAQEHIRSFVRSYLSTNNSVKQNIVLYFYGTYGSGKRHLVEVICHDLKLPIIIVDLEKIASGELSFDEMIWLIGRETLLQSSALCLENFDCLINGEGKNKSYLKSVIEAIQTFSSLTFLLSSRPWKPQGFLKELIFIDLELPIPDDRSRKLLWENHLNGHLKLTNDLDLDELAGKFRFTEGQIQDALSMARNLTIWRSSGKEEVSMEDLYAACRAQSNQKLSSLAQKIEPKYTWYDIVLPPDQLSQLKELCNQAKYRQKVYGEWGFDRKLSMGKGLNVLFSGPSGTGKTMAVEIIANELKLDLYKIDLSQVVSKYIGETEKNLDKIFNEAKTSNSILFFDEADALFGKRSEVKDAHDRYANIEIGYLLQKMEEYDGIAILTTNLRQNMDEAFVRRIQIIVEFPFPDEEYRRRIWKVVFPAKEMIGIDLLSDDVDFGLLAREVKLPGGNIKNIALMAAFYAAEDKKVIRMNHLIRAIRREHQKLGRAWDEAKWSSFLNEKKHLDISN